MSTATTVSNRPYMTRAERQRLIDDCIRRHGSFDNQGFVDEVRTTGPDHPAFAFFDWDDAAAGNARRLMQVRQFLKDLVIIVTAPKVVKAKAFKVAAETARVARVAAPLTVPAFIDMESSEKPVGGGYEPFDVKDPEQVKRFRNKASVALSSWLNRYRYAVMQAGGDVAQVEALIDALWQD